MIQTSAQGAQIDHLIDRKDGNINLCGMKFTDTAFEIDKVEKAGSISLLRYKGKEEE